jgi:N-methylhydantoinase B/oxoprolinase/acetone carboxylase alpha subunit
VAQEQARTRIDQAKAEMDVKLKALEQQAKSANQFAKARIEKHIAELKADFAVRSQKLNQAWNLTKEALAA